MGHHRCDHHRWYHRRSGGATTRMNSNLEEDIMDWSKVADHLDKAAEGANELGQRWLEMSLSEPNPKALERDARDRFRQAEIYGVFAQAIRRGLSDS